MSKPYAKITIVKYEKKENTKTVYNEVSREYHDITSSHYNNIITSSPFFRRLGGSEYHEKCYTVNGYKTVKLISKSPDREYKTVYTFDFQVN